MPASAWPSGDCMFRCLRTNDTVSGVSVGVVPNTEAPGSVAALIPEGTWVGVLGLVLAAALAPGADAQTVRLTPAATPSSIPAPRRAPLRWIIPVHRPIRWSQSFAIIATGCG